MDRNTIIKSSKLNFVTPLMWRKSVNIKAVLKAWRSVPAGQQKAIAIVGGSILLVLGVTLSAVVDRPKFGSSEEANLPSLQYSASDQSYFESNPDYRAPQGNSEMSRNEQIRALENSDPASYGYTDADREFLRDHGVSESEARAVEEILAREGIQ